MVAHGSSLRSDSPTLGLTGESEGSKVPLVPGVKSAIAALAALATASVAMAAPAYAQAPADEVVPGQLLVRFEPGTGDAAGARIAAGQGAEVVDRFSAVPRLTLVDLPAGLGVAAAEDRFEALAGVAVAQPNRVFELAAEPNDPFFADGKLWALSNYGQDVPDIVSPAGMVPGGTVNSDIDAPEAWDLQQGNAAVRVGVIDSGITAGHEDISANLWHNQGEIPANDVDDDSNGRVDDIYGWDFVEDQGSPAEAGDPVPDDSNSHGTHVAGTIGAVGNNGIGSTGVSWDLSLMALKAGTADGLLYESAIIDAIGYADQMGAKVVNASYSGGGSDAVDDISRIAYQNASDVLFVAAAGNDGANVDASSRYPCAYSLPNVLCVAATDPSDGLAGFSSYGNTTVDLAAPGTNLLSTVPAFDAPVLFDDFEDGDLDEWVMGGDPANSWSLTTSSPKLGVRALTDSNAGSYTNDENSWIRTAAPFDLSGLDSCRLNFALAHTLGAGDTLRVEYTTDADPETGVWYPLHVNPYAGTGAFALRNLDFDFREATGHPAVHLRFRLVTNSAGGADGVQIDDVKVECVDVTASAYRARQGTSMAAPHVSGVAALLAAEYPGYGVEGLRNALLAGVDPLGSLQCKTVSGGRVNAFRSLMQGAPASAPDPSCPPVTEPEPDPVVKDPVVQDPPTVKKPNCKKKKLTAKAKKRCKRARAKEAKAKGSSRG